MKNWRKNFPFDTSTVWFFSLIGGMNATNLLKPQRLNPLNDYLFLKVMGEKGDEIQLLSFLNAVLGRTGNDRLVSVEIIETKTFSAEFIGDKASILDVRALLLDGSKVNIEVQLRNQGNFDRRSLFYWSREYVKGIKAGQNYHDLPAVISINIIDFEFLETERFHTIFHLREDKETNIVLTDALEIHFIDMVKWRKQCTIDVANEPLHRWLAWMDRASPPELVEEVVTMDSAIMAANDRQVYVSGDEEAIRAYEMRELGLMDINGGLIWSRKEGKAEGIAEGIAKGESSGYERANLEIARKMKAMGDSTEKICVITGLPTETIEKLN